MIQKTYSLIIGIMCMSMSGAYVPQKTNNTSVETVTDPVGVPCYKADIIFVLDVSSSMSCHRQSVYVWMQDIVRRLPISRSIHVGLIHFASTLCATVPLTAERDTLLDAVYGGYICPETGTELFPACFLSHQYFVLSEEYRNEAVPKILILVSDGDVSDEEEVHDVYDRVLADVYWFCINPNKKTPDNERPHELLVYLTSRKGTLHYGSLPDINDALYAILEPCI